MKRFAILLTAALLLLLSACDTSPQPPAQATDGAPQAATSDDAAEPTPTLAPLPQAATDALPGDLLISEVLVGVPGDNNAEFIELYNASDAPVDLQGMTLVHKLKADDGEEVVYAWRASAEIPANGHFLLTRSGADVGVPGDATFDTALFGKGGLILRDADGNTLDTVGWGDAPEGFVLGAPATAPDNGDSLERLPGGADGHAAGTDNSSDIVAIKPPNPQNSGSTPTPAIAGALQFSVTPPQQVEPGASFAYELSVTNPSQTGVTDVIVHVPVSDVFSVQTLPDGADLADGAVTWSVGSLEPGATASARIELQAPFDYADALLRGSYAVSAETGRTYGPVSVIAVSGGTLPIGVLRDLPAGSTATVEGVATMYTDGFFAGSTGTKFYIEDDSGGVQVYVPGGKGAVNVDIGDRVRVTGATEVYRTSFELVPGDFSADISIVGADEPLRPTPITVEEAETDDAVLGRLAQVEGTATRIEEFTFSYEIDLVDEAGNATLIYVEKDTGVSAEPLALEEQYRITGISEQFDGERQLKPRLQDDIRRVFPPILRVTVDAPASTPAGPFEVVITAHNHTPNDLEDVTVRAALPQGGLVTGIRDGGGLSADNRAIVWQLPTLPGNDGSADVRFTITPLPDSATVRLPAVDAAAGEQVDPAATVDAVTFIGDGVPLWAIQGAGERSPYLTRVVTTTGVVTGVFPDLDGFWIQAADGDGDPATSDGLFVLAEEIEPGVTAGDQIRLSGLVRELGDQTTLALDSADSITPLASDTSLPDPVLYDPPRDSAEAAAYKEALEGMLVATGGPAIVIAPTTQYGEFVVLDDRWGVNSVRRTDDTGFFIFVDDGSSVRHNDQTTQSVVVTKGDTVAGLTGPLAYTFGHYKIQPVVTPTVQVAERALPTLPSLAENQFSIATFNLENLFDPDDPNPSSPPKPSADAYAHRLDKSADAILRMGAPTILGVQEVENVRVLEDIAAHPLLAEFAYQPALIEGDDSRGIDVGYLARGDQASIDQLEAFPAPEGVTSRHPLLLEATINVGDAPQTVYILNNHFTSLAGGEAATEPRRTAQAAWNVSILDEIREANPDAQIVVLGDLNSFLETPPLDTLADADLRHVYEYFADPNAVPYTYIFEGATQTLDHILLSPSLFAQLSTVTAPALNADYPLAQPDDATARRLSDHDPLLAVFTVE